MSCQNRQRKNKFLGFEILESRLVMAAPFGIGHGLIGRTLEGEAQDSDTPLEYVTVECFADGQLIGTALANNTKIYQGLVRNNSYRFELPPSLLNDGLPHLLEVYALDTTDPVNGPRTLVQQQTLSSSPVPQLSSKPGAPVTFYLDFDGHVESSWNGYSNVVTPGFDIDGIPNFLSNEEVEYIETIYRTVAEDFAPFDVNVTTVNPGTFNNRQGLRVSIGGNGNWYSSTASGAAQLESFTNNTPNTVFVFTDKLVSETANPGEIIDRRGVGDVATHVIGLALGLRPHSTYDVNGIKTQAYTTGNTQVGPLMGKPGQAAHSTWWVGPTDLSPNSIQDDIAVITNPLVGPDNGIQLRPDDHGDAFANPTQLNYFIFGNGTNPFNYFYSTADGVINRTDDVDVFRFELPLTFPYLRIQAIGRENESNLNLQIRLHNAAGSVIAEELTGEPIEFFSQLNPGTYFLSVSTNGDYGSLGRYRIFVGLDIDPEGETFGRTELPPPDLPLPDSPAAASGDFNSDGFVDGIDLGRWQAAYSTLGGLFSNGDSDSDGDVDGRDYLAWQRSAGAGSGGSLAALHTYEIEAIDQVMGELQSAPPLESKPRFEVFSRPVALRYRELGRHALWSEFTEELPVVQDEQRRWDASKTSQELTPSSTIGEVSNSKRPAKHFKTHDKLLQFAENLAFTDRSNK